MIKIFKLFNQNQKKDFLILLNCMLVVSILEMASLTVLLPILNIFLGLKSNFNNEQFLLFFDFFNINFNNFSLVAFLIIFLIFFIAKVLFSIYVAWKNNNFIFNFINNISFSLYSKYLSQEYKDYSIKNTSELMRNILREIDYFYLFLHSSTLIILESIILFGIFCFLIYFVTYPTLISLLIISIVSLSYFFAVKKNFLTWGKDRQKIEENRIKYMQEGFASIKEINFFNRNFFFLKRFKNKNNQFYKITTNYNFLNSIPRLIFELFTIFMLASIFIFLIISGKSNQEIIKIVALFFAASFRIIPSVYRIFTCIQNLKYSQHAFSILFSDYNSIIQKKIFTNFTGLIFENNIKLNIKNYSYQNNEINFQLKNISLKIKKNEKIGLIGKSGSGKSTLISVLVGILRSNNIKLEVDKKLIYEPKDILKWQSIIGLIPQNINLLNESLKKNILFGLDENKYSEKDIIKVLKLVKLFDLYKSLPNGLNYNISEKGLNFSGGEIQRIGIARALIFNPKILIFDEATSALDTFTENEILKDINNLQNKTMVFISHRMNTLKFCDKIYLIDKGQIKDSGSFKKFNNRNYNVL